MLEKIEKLESDLVNLKVSVQKYSDDGVEPQKCMFVSPENLELAKNVLELTVAMFEMVSIMKEWYKTMHAAAPVAVVQPDEMS